MSTPVGYGPVSAEAVLWAAEQVIRQHNEQASEHRATGQCKQCTTDGCQMLVWAQTVSALPRTGQPPGSR